jgi:hypothetical protein
VNAYAGVADLDRPEPHRPNSGRPVARGPGLLGAPQPPGLNVGPGADGLLPTPADPSAGSILSPGTSSPGLTGRSKRGFGAG